MELNVLIDNEISDEYFDKSSTYTPTPTLNEIYNSITYPKEQLKEQKEPKKQLKSKKYYDDNLEFIQKCQKFAFKQLSYLNQLKITMKDVKDTSTYLELSNLYDKILINFDILGSLFIEKSKEGCLPNHIDDNYIFKCNDDFSLIKEYIVDYQLDLKIPSNTNTNTNIHKRKSQEENQKEIKKKRN